MRELFKTGNYICVAKGGGDSKSWHKQVMKQPWDDNHLENATHTRLIHKKHEHILDAYLKGCDIYVEDITDNKFSNIANYPNNFIEGYNQNYNYEAVPKSLEKCYCKANELHEIILNKTYSIYGNNYKNWDFVIIDPPSKQYGVFRTSGGLSELTDKHKKIQFNKKLNNWTYCPYKEKTNERYIMGNNDNNNVSDRLANSKTILNNFKDYGFTADFEGEILKEIDGLYIGWVKIQEVEGIFIEPMIWNKNGTTKQFDTYSLTPIKKEWYDDLNNFPALIVEENGSLFNHYIVYNKNSFLDLQDSCIVRLATKEEISNLYYKNK